MLFWPFDNEEVKPRRARRTLGYVLARALPTFSTMFVLAAVFLTLMVGDTRATSVGTDSMVTPSATAASEEKPQTAASPIPSASSTRNAIPNVAKKSTKVKPLQKSENFVALPTPEPSKARPSATRAAARAVAPQKASSRPTRTRRPAVAKKASERHTAPVRGNGGKGLRALAYAQRQIGERYVMNAAGPNSWDCSGLTMKAWGSVGVSLPHSARQQFSKGRYVSKSNLRKGDLVFFYHPIHHVGIYAGNGKVLHASNPSKPVGYLPMKYMPYAGARRLG